MYQQFKEDPSSVDPSWRELLENYQPGGDSASNGKAPSAKAAPASANGTPAPVSYTHLTLPTNREV